MGLDLKSLNALKLDVCKDDNIAKFVYYGKVRLADYLAQGKEFQDFKTFAFHSCFPYFIRFIQSDEFNQNQPSMTESY